MNRIYNIALLSALMALVLAGTNTHAENTVSGTFTINDDAVKINHVYTDQGPNDIMIVLTDIAVPEDSIPFGVAGLAMEGKVRGIVLTMDPESKQIDKQGYNVLYDKAWEGQLGTIGNGVLTIDKLDRDMIEGTIRTTGPNTYSDSFAEKDYVYTYDIKFKANLVSRDL